MRVVKDFLVLSRYVGRFGIINGSKVVGSEGGVGFLWVRRFVW